MNVQLLNEFGFPCIGWSLGMTNLYLQCSSKCVYLSPNVHCRKWQILATK